MKFYSITDPKPSTGTPAGSPDKPEYMEKIDENGKTVVYESGKTSLYDQIQAALPATQIYNILERYTQTGDASILTSKMGVYDDITNAPKDLAEAHRRIKDIENNFDKLPLEIRKEFNNSANEFIAKMATGDKDSYQAIEKYFLKKGEELKETVKVTLPKETDKKQEAKEETKGDK